VVAHWVMSWLSASHNSYIRSFVSHLLLFTMSPSVSPTNNRQSISE
jgi:hypothetical protein